MRDHKERHEEQLNASAEVLSTTNRAGRFVLIGVGTAVTGLLWALHLGFFRSLRGGSMLGAMFSMRGMMVLFFIPPFIAAYGLGKHWMPQTQPEEVTGVMSSYTQIHASNREWKLMIFAAAVGVINSFLMVFTTPIK